MSRWNIAYTLQIKLLARGGHFKFLQQSVTKNSGSVLVLTNYHKIWILSIELLRDFSSHLFARKREGNLRWLLKCFKYFILRSFKIFRADKCLRLESNQSFKNIDRLLSVSQGDIHKHFCLYNFHSSQESTIFHSNSRFRFFFLPQEIIKLHKKIFCEI